jgi:hypothetical protein
MPSKAHPDAMASGRLATNGLNALNLRSSAVMNITYDGGRQSETQTKDSSKLRQRTVGVSEKALVGEVHGPGQGELVVQSCQALKPLDAHALSLLSLLPGLNVQ